MRSEKSNCIIDNIHLESYVESMLSIYFPFTSSNHNDLVLLAVHVWDMTQAM